MAVRVSRYSTTLPSAGLARRSTLASVLSAGFHVLLVVGLIFLSLRQRRIAAEPVVTEQARPIQLVFAPPRPEPTPRLPVPTLPEVRETPPPLPLQLAPGPDETPGSTARVTPDPETDPNSAPNTPREEATRPDPGPDQAEGRTDPGASSPAPFDPLASESRPSIESEARRIFGRPSTKLGPVSGSRDNRPWESPIETSRGCTVPPEEKPDSTLPAGMAMVSGKIYRQDNGQPLGNARLQILGTPYGTFTNARGEYRLLFDRTLVDRCRTQSVRVTAPGYESRDVTLYLGDRPNSDVPLRRY